MLPPREDVVGASPPKFSSPVWRSTQDGSGGAREPKASTPVLQKVAPGSGAPSFLHGMTGNRVSKDSTPTSKAVLGSSVPTSFDKRLSTQELRAIMVTPLK